jgi:hypothetical protein
MRDTRWDHALKVTGGGTGLIGHAGAVLLRKAADQAGLTAALSAALAGPCLILQPDFVIFMVRGLVAGSGRFWPGAGGAAATSTIAAGAGCFWPGR